MVGPRRIRTERLLRIYLTLLAVSLVLIAAGIYRHFPGLFTPANPLQQASVAAPQSFSVSHPSAAPTINWGGQRR